MADDYVFCDGSTSTPHIPSKWHDCIMTYDMQFVSLNAVWDAARAAGYTPVIMFACKPNETAHEITWRGKTHGAFSAACFEVMEDNPQMPLGDAFRRINKRFREMEITQTAEVLCTGSQLLEPFLGADFIIISDACRIVDRSLKTISKLFEDADLAPQRHDHRNPASVQGEKQGIVLTFSGHGRLLLETSF